MVGACFGAKQRIFRTVIVINSNIHSRLARQQYFLPLPHGPADSGGLVDAVATTVPW
jgi:hypothetical protein